MLKRLSTLVLGTALIAGAVGAFAAPRHHDHDPRLCNDASHDHGAFERRQRDRHYRPHHPRRWWAERRQRGARWQAHLNDHRAPVRRHWAPHRYDTGCRTVTVIRRDRHGRPYEVRQSACRDRHGDLVLRDRSVGRLRF